MSPIKVWNGSAYVDASLPRANVSDVPKEGYIWNGSAYVRVWPPYLDYIDTFNRANGPAGAEWATAQYTGQSGVLPVIVSNQYKAGTTTTNNTNTQQGAVNIARPTWTNDQVVIGTLGGNLNGLYTGLMARAASTNTFVICALTSSQMLIQYWINGVASSSMATYSNPPLQNGDQLEWFAMDNRYTAIRNRAGSSTLFSYTTLFRSRKSVV